MIVKLSLPAICAEMFLKSDQFKKKVVAMSGVIPMTPFELCHEKTCLLRFQPDLTQTSLYNHRSWIKA